MYYILWNKRLSRLHLLNTHKIPGAIFVSSKLLLSYHYVRPLDGSRVFFYGYIICQHPMTAYLHVVNTSFIDCSYSMWVFRNCTLPKRHQHSVNSLNVVLVNTDCSFPFTYNGGLYYSCIENMTDVSTPEQPLACLKVNAIPAVCDCPGGSF